ncbi:MAG: ATP-binding cassette domain-containing protein, partial [Clostridia bacterium]|nr:ATP-binding cassette domain-containing protein [Clostridia bacterium]
MRAKERPWRRLFAPALLLVVWAGLPYLLAGRLSLSILVLVFLYTPIVAGIAVLSGYAGQVSLGQAAFYGTGAYITAILTTRADLSPWLGIPLAVLGSALFAYLVGRPILALRGHYLVIATLGLNIILVVLLREWSGLTGGANGLSGIPPLRAFGVALKGDLFYYYATGLVAGLALWASANLVRSRFGRALLFVRTSEAAAAAFGVDAGRMKSLAFVWSAALAALSGALYAHYVTFISPSPFDFTFSVELLVMAVVGGLSSIPGAALGCFIFVVLRQILARALPATLGAGASAQAEVVVFGLVLALVVVLAPAGLWPTVGAVWRRRRAQPGPDAVLAAAGPIPSAEAGPGLTGLMGPSPEDGSAILSVRGATRRFGGLTAVADVSFNARAGEVLAIVGPNGAGKTTLFNLVSALVTPSAGAIRLLGRDVTRL